MFNDLAASICRRTSKAALTTGFVLEVFASRLDGDSEEMAREKARCLMVKYASLLSEQNDVKTVNVQSTACGGA